MKQRVDLLLVELGYFKTRQKAQDSIKEGLVCTEGLVVKKPSEQFDTNTVFVVDSYLLKYVSRGGFKLEAAIETFNFELNDCIVLDIGASTGGFTDCALRQGAKHVYAVDVGTLQLAQELKEDPRVTSYEKTNILEISDQYFTSGIPSRVVMDVSFVSIIKLLPHIYQLTQDFVQAVVLLKPQFEAGSLRLSKQGILKHKKDHYVVVKETLEAIKDSGWYVNHMIHSPIVGGDGNIEYLLYLSKKDNGLFIHANQVIDVAFDSLKRR